MRLSRHVRNNMRLYGISESDIIRTIETPDRVETEGSKSIAFKALPRKFSGYPLKVVYEGSGRETTVITAYPLKRKQWR